MAHTKRTRSSKSQQPTAAKARRTNGKPKKAGRSSGGAGPEELREFVRAKGPEYLKDPNVTSIGIAQTADGDYCIQFTVGKKLSRDDVAGIESLGTKPLPETIEVAGQEIPTAVVERTFRPSYQLVKGEQVKDRRKQRLDPVVPGISVSHPKGTAGTLGLIVFDSKTGEPCLLSNWHVLHTDQGNIGDPIVQPGPFDDDRVDLNQTGVLVRSHLGPAGDCAIARLEGRRFDPGILELGVSVRSLARPELGDRVVKSGRTTGVTRGVVRRVDVLAKIDYDGAGEMTIGGFEIGPPEGADELYEVSMGGDSGSAWVIQDGKTTTEIMVGLHFAGEAGASSDEHALACYAHSVFEKLEISLSPPVRPLPGEAGPFGYNVNFLRQPVPTPSLKGKTKDAFKLNGGVVIPYTHFSVCQSKSRGFAHFVAWNIDGASLKAFGRKGLRFRRDPRIPDDFQVGDELYANNNLDRGHLARRADVVWGPAAEAQRANRDSFFFTNISPQHARFNQSERGGLWGLLENAIFEDTDVEDLRVSVLGGPVFSDDDPIYRKVKVPRSFWKVLLFVDEADRKLKAKAYVLTQRNLLNDIEIFELDPFRMYQISVRKLEQMIGLDLGATVRAADAFVAPQAAEGVGGVDLREITSRADLAK